MGKIIKQLLMVMASLVMIASTIFMTGCEEIPGYQLTAEQKLQDFEWVLAIFDHNYAPMQMKERLHGFNYNELKAKYKKRIADSKTNQEYIDLVQQFVAEFADGHTQIRLTSSALPGRVTTSYMGFSGIRKGDGLLVKSILPTMRNKDNFPIKEGNYITHVTVKNVKYSLKEYVDKFLVKQINVGDQEANYTSLMNVIFNRLSTVTGVAEEDGMILTLRDEFDDKESKDIWLPFIKKDVAEFKLEMSKAKKAEVAGTGLLKGLKLVMGDDKGESEQEFEVTLMNNYGKPFDMNFVQNFVRQHTESNGVLSAMKTFQVRPMLSGWRVNAVNAGGDVEASGMELLKKERNVPEYVIPVEAAKTYPAYIQFHEVKDSRGRRRGVKPVGYLRIHTFSPGGKEADVLQQIEETLDAFQENGVKDVVIDTVNNGGGSVSLILKLAQLLSNEKILNFGIQYGLNQKWMDDVQKAMMGSPNDTEREIMKRLFAEFQKAAEKGDKITDVVSIETLMPYTLEPNPEKKRDFNYVLTINEMCASAADMFAQLFRTNGMGVIIGKKTMGAGGNVRQHMSSPYMHFILNQTESLLVAPEALYAKGANKNIDKYYLENAGVEPDLDMDVSFYADGKYSGVIDKAVEVLLKKKEYEKYYKAAKARHKRAIQVRKTKGACLKELI